MYSSSIVNPIWLVNTDVRLHLFACIEEKSPSNTVHSQPSTSHTHHKHVTSCCGSPEPSPLVSRTRYPTGASVFWNITTWTIFLSGAAMLFLGIRYCKKIKHDIKQERENKLRDALLQKQLVVLHITRDVRARRGSFLCCRFACMHQHEPRHTVVALTLALLAGPAVARGQTAPRSHCECVDGTGIADAKYASSNVTLIPPSLRSRKRPP